MITTLKYFEAIDTTGVNSETEVKKRAIMDKINEFNSKKSSLDSITSRPVEQWEEQAKNIIKDNEYLAKYWRLVKNKYDLDILKKSSIPTESNKVTKRNNDLRDLQKDVSDIEKELNDTIIEDKKILI